MIVIATMLLIAAIILGVIQGLRGTELIVRLATVIGLLLLSNLLAAWPYFQSPSSWARTYFSALLRTGAGSLVFHAVPYFVAWIFGRMLSKRKASVR